MHVALFLSAKSVRSPFICLIEILSLLLQYFIISEETISFLSLIDSKGSLLLLSAIPIINLLTIFRDLLTISI